MTDETLLTPAELAERLRLTEVQVMELRRRHGWPSIRFGRKLRFTAEQVEQIVALHTQTAPEQPKVTVIEGQTKGSRSRRSA